MKSRQNSVNEIFNPHEYFFFLLTAAIWYYHAIYIVLTYFVSFTGFKDDSFEVIYNFHVQGSKFCRKLYKFGVKSSKEMELRRVYGFCFFLVCCVSVSLCKYLYVCLFVCNNVCLSVCLSLNVYMKTCVSFCWNVSLSTLTIMAVLSTGVRGKYS